MNVTKRMRLRVVAAATAPFVMYNSTSNSFYGYCIDLLKAMQEVSDFDYDIKESSDKEFGYLSASGKWTGMIGDLLTNTADMAVGALWVTHRRQQVVDYTIPFYKNNGFTIMMRKGKKSTAFLWFLTILDHHIWLHFIAGFLVTSILMYFFEHYSPYSYRNAPERYKDNPNPRFASLKECFWFCATSLTPIGGGETPKNLSGTLVAAIWWLFGFVFVASYTANLTAYQTLYRLERHIQTVDDLRRQYQVDYSTILNSPTYRYFKNLKDNEEILSNLWRQMSLNKSLSAWERRKLVIWEYPVEEKHTKVFNTMRKTGFLIDIQEAVNNVRKVNRSREFAYIGQAMPIRYLALTNCDLMEVGDEFGKRPYAFAIRKGSSLKNKLDEALTQVMVQGILPKLEKKWWDENPLKAQCPDSNKIHTTFKLADMTAIFVLIFIGIFLASIILCLQYCWYTIKKRCDEKKQRLFIKAKKIRTPKKLWEFLK